MADPTVNDRSHPYLVPPPERDRFETQLPAPLSSFVGRERELTTVVDLLRRHDVRLLTLTGPGGVGKTRMAIRAAEKLADEFADGVAFVPLASITNHGLVVPTIAQTLGVRQARNRPLAATLETTLRNRNLLVVLDNFEQVIEAAPVIAHILGTCPDLKFLVTSRALLRVSGEHDFRVPPLSVPDPTEQLELVADAEAVQLFVERAQEVDPAFHLSPANTLQVAKICARLDGLPLAVELAAAKTRWLPPDALLARLSERLPMLSGGPRDAPARLRTMRDAIAWSHDLLSDEEQTLFRRLAFFAGGFTLEAAEAVTGEPNLDVFAGVEGLVDQSLVRRLDMVAGEPRFGMLETVREFGLEQLKASGEERAIRELHAKYFLALAEEAEPQLRSSAQDQWLEQLQTAHDDLRAALAWSRTADPELALRLAGALHWFWYLRGNWSEGRRWLDDALSIGDTSVNAPARMKALAGAGVLAFMLGDQADARARLGESAAIGRERADPAGTAYGLLFLDMGELYLGEQSVDWHLSECVDLFRAAGDKWGLAAALCSRGIVAIRLGDPAASPLIEESLSLSREVGDAWVLARALNYAGEWARLAGDAANACRYYEESLTLYRKLGHRDGAARVLHNLGYAYQHLGDLRRAAECFSEALAVGRERADSWNVAHYAGALAGTALALGDPERAARLLGAASGPIEALGAWPTEAVEHQRTLDAARAQVGSKADLAWAKGRALPLETAVAEATEVAAAGLRLLPHRALSTDSAPRLTPRELDVLRLLVAGKSNPEIAEILFVSPRTAQTHVTNILAKLGVATRTEAAAYTVRDNLV